MLLRAQDAAADAALRADASAPYVSLLMLLIILLCQLLMPLFAAIAAQDACR